MKWKFYKGILPLLLIIFGGSLPAKADFFRDIKKGFSKAGRGFSGIDDQCYTACTRQKGCTGNEPSSQRGAQNYRNSKKNCKAKCKKGESQGNNQDYGRNNRRNHSYYENNDGYDDDYDY